MKPTRVVIIAIVFTMVATLYSLSELHRMSTEHAAKEDKTHKFATHVDDKPVIAANKPKGRCRAWYWMSLYT